MKIKNYHLITLITLIGLCTNAQATFKNSRDGKWEFFLAPMLSNSKVLEFDNGAEASISKRSAIGFGLGYNLSNHIELTLLFSSSNGNYTGTRIIDNSPEDPDVPNGPQKFTSNLHISSMNFGFTFNFFSTPFTPYISTTIGSSFVDTGIPTGDLVTRCRFDPWWGYVCSPHAQTYTTTKINYGAGLGLRYDFNRKLYIKGGVAKNYIDFDSNNSPDFTTYQFIFGFMF